MNYRSAFAASVALLLLGGCSSRPVWIPPITSVIPSGTGIPISVAVQGNYEFVSVQGTGQIFTYDIASGFQKLAVPPYATPCQDPSGMVLTTIAGNSVMAVVCYDTSSLVTLTVNQDGSLSPLGAVAGLPQPYPGTVLDGVNVFVPLMGQPAAANGAVARVSIASPANPVLTGLAPLASPAPGQFVNPGNLAAAGGNIYAAAGSEPEGALSTVQVVNESSMAIVGTPLVVAHSPQQVAIQGNVLLVTIFDATELESIDISNPANLSVLNVTSLATATSTCHALPVAFTGGTAYVGCYDEGTLEQFDLSNPSSPSLTRTITGISSPQRILPSGQFLLVPDSSAGGAVYQINLDSL